jgi:hypothetical protein
VIEEALIENITCDPGLDPTDPADDTYTFNITVTGFNNASSWTADDPNSSVGVYNTIITLGPYLISDGDLNFTITDADDIECNIDVTVQPPATCSNLCLIQEFLIDNMTVLLLLLM